MANDKKQNGGFQTKLSMAQLRTEVLQNKLDAKQIMEKYGVKSYTLRDKLFQAAQTATNKTEALKTGAVFNRFLFENIIFNHFIFT